jgi:alpha-D-ribose 1-methylphosphonate 5-triphosphate synthase subunit PhnH
MAPALALGFADPVTESQRVFRALMDALARPGTVHRLETALRPPAPLTPELACVALTLADHEAPLWLDAPLAQATEVAQYLRFHTGAAIVTDPGEAAFALVADPVNGPAFEAFAPGGAEYPDRSTTIVFSVTRIADKGGFRLKGPGILTCAELDVAPLPPDMPERLEANRRLFPRGVDCLFVAPGRVAGLPRSTELVQEA